MQVICANVLKGSCTPDMKRFKECKHGIAHEEMILNEGTSAQQLCTEIGYCDTTNHCCCVPVEANAGEPVFSDYVQWVEDLVQKYGVEIDYFAWEEIKKKLKE